MAVIVNGDGILTGISSLATALTDITSGRGTITGVTTVGTLQLGAGVSISSPRTQNAAIFTNNTEFLTVDDAGRVGVGTITPNSDAHPENEKKINVGFITARSIAGDIDANTMVVAGVSTFVGALNAGAVSGTTGTFSSDINANGGTIKRASTNSRIIFQDSNETRLYHAANAQIKLAFRGNGDVFRGAVDAAAGYISLKTGADEVALVARDNSFTELYYDASKRLHTTPSGVDVSGTINVTGVSTFATVTTTGSVTIDTASNGLPSIYLTHSNSGADDWRIMAGVTGVSNSGFSIYDVNSTTSRFIIDTNGNVGINNTAPVEKLGISGNMRFINPNDNTSRISALPSGTYTVGNSGGSAIAFHRVSDGGGGSDEIAFETHWQGNFHGERLRIEKTGDIKVNGGDLYFGTAGKGIVLGATSNVGANTLDDYEEGTFTPTQPTTGFNSASGNYVKIGRYVYANIFCTLPTNSSGVAFYIDSLPFTSLNNSGTNIHGGYAIYSTYGSPITVRVHDNSTRAQVSAIGGNNITLNPLDNVNFRLQVHYMTN